MDLQHNLMPFEKSSIFVVEGGTRIDTYSLKKQLIAKKTKGGQHSNKLITPLTDINKLGRLNSLIHYAHQ